jgi:glycosyltransferase involved in cell wall biosynthesis
VKEVQIDNQLVSVVVPLYNGGRYIESTLMSVLSQSYNNYEVIVVDDGSTDDGSQKVTTIMEQHPRRIQLIYHSDHGNYGIAASRNLAIRNAKGVYVAFIDQDDIWLPNKLEKQVEALQQFPEAALVYAKVTFVDQEGGGKKLRSVHSTYGRGVAWKPQNVFRKLVKEDFIPNLTVLVRKSCLERVGFLDEGPRYEYEDWLLLSKMAYFYKFIFIPEVLGKWRLHNSNYSTHIFEMGHLCDAGEHYTITLFSFLMNQKGISFDDVRKLLHRRLWLFFLRARSWGVSKELLEKHASNFLNVFPSEHRTIRAALRAVTFFHPKIAVILRRIRRAIMGM